MQSRSPAVLWVSALAFVVGCAGGAAAEDASGDGPSDESEADLKAACAGAACATLGAPKPLMRGGLAVSAGRLAWMERPGTAAAAALDAELVTCALPGCASTSRIAFATSDGTPLRLAHGSLASIKGGFAVVGRANGRAQLFVSDGASPFRAVGPELEDDMDDVAVDATALIVGSARGHFVTTCPIDLAATKPGACTTFARTVWVKNVALTPTRAVIASTTGVASYDRASLAPATYRGELPDEVRLQLATVGEKIYSASVLVRTRSGKVVHDTLLTGASDSGVVQGVISSHASDGTSLYVSTRAEGDVFGVARDGVVARFTPGKGPARTLARGQEPSAVAVDGAAVYWLDVSSVAAGTDDPVGAVRWTKK